MKKHAPFSDLMKNAAPITFGLIIVLGFFGILGLLFYSPFPDTNKDLITSLSKTLENILIMAVSYWFGNNSASKSKDETISDIAKMPVAPIAPVAPVAPVLPLAPINIPNAESVNVETKEGNINLTQRDKS